MFRSRFKEPTTKSTAQEFRDFLNDIGYNIDMVVDTHAREHRSVYTEHQRNGYGRLTMVCPDVDGLSIGMSSVFSMLWSAADEILEAEQRLEYVEEEDNESDEYQHALGELFGAKTIFISMYRKVAELERERIAATQSGKNQRAFLRSVISGEGHVLGESISTDYSQRLSNTNQLRMNPNLIATGTISASSLQMKNPFI